MSTESNYPGPKHSTANPVTPSLPPASAPPSSTAAVGFEKAGTSTTASVSASGGVKPKTIGPDGSEVSIGRLVQDATANISTLIRGEVELAKLELKSSVKNGSTGLVFFVVAGVLLIFALTFGLIAFAEGLVALHLWRWAAYLIVFGAIVLIAVLLALVGWKKVKKVRPPKRTIDTAKETVAYLRNPPTP